MPVYASTELLELAGLTPSYTWIPAPHFGTAFNRGIWWIVLHTAESPETPTGAEGVARFFRDVSPYSAHYTVDSDSICQCVRDENIAFAAPPNTHGLHIELSGVAAQSLAQWHDPYSSAELKLAAALVAAKAKEHGIPIVFLSPADLKAGKKGITSHNNISLAFRQSDHTDPGPNFPFDEFIGMVRVLAGDPTPIPPVPPAPAGLVKGMDISSWQGTGVWPPLRGKARFAYIRCGRGMDEDDSLYGQNVAGALSIGAAPGAYLLGKPYGDPAAQAAHFRAIAGPVTPGVSLRPCLDIEDDQNKPQPWTLAFAKAMLAEMEHQFGCKPIIYSTISYLTSHGMLPLLRDYDLWAAHWVTQADVTWADLPSAVRDSGARVVCWQWTATKGPINDGDVTNDLAALLVPGGPPTPTPPTVQEDDMLVWVDSYEDNDTDEAKRVNIPAGLWSVSSAACTVHHIGGPPTSDEVDILGFLPTFKVPDMPAQRVTGMRLAQLVKSHGYRQV